MFLIRLWGKKIHADMKKQVSKWIEKGPWYNTIISSKLNVQSFEDYLKTGLRDRYELMCAFNVYEKEHASMTDYISSGVGIPMPSIPYK